MTLGRGARRVIAGELRGDYDARVQERKRLEQELSERSKEYELLRRRKELLLP